MLRAVQLPTLPKPWMATEASSSPRPKRCFITARVDIGDAEAGGILTADGAADVDRLAGDDGGDGVAFVHGVGVHDPGHDLGVGADIGGRNIPIGADEEADLGRVSPGQALKLGQAQFAGIDDDPAFGSAVGQVHQRAFPSHPHGQGAAFSVTAG